MRKTRFGLWLAFAALASIITISSAAQDDVFDFCFDLPADDCALINSASENTRRALNSFNADYSLLLDISGLEALGLGDDLNFAVNGSGQFQLREAAALTVESMQLDMVAVVEGEDQPVSAVLVNSDFYFRAGAEGEWRGGNLIDAFTQLQSELSAEGMAGFNLPLQALLTAPPDQADFDSFALGLPDASPLIAALAVSNPDLPGLIRYHRLPDESGEEQTLYPFALIIDFRPLITSRQFRSIVQQGLTLATSLDPSSADISDIISMVLPTVLEQSGAQLNITQYIGADDALIRRLELDLSALIDLSALFGSAAGSDVITFDFAFSVKLNQINQPIHITTPENFAPLLEIETTSN
jgi:hypothetical protein